MKQTEILTHATHVNGWFPAVYMSYMSQNFRLFHASNLSVRNFRIFLLMYTGRATPAHSSAQFGRGTHTRRVVSPIHHTLCDAVRLRPGPGTACPGPYPRVLRHEFRVPCSPSRVPCPDSSVPFSLLRVCVHFPCFCPCPVFLSHVQCFVYHVIYPLPFSLIFVFCIRLLTHPVPFHVSSHVPSRPIPSHSIPSQ